MTSALDPHLGLAAYFATPIRRDRDRVKFVAELLVDPRWPWLPWWASFVGLDKRDDRSSVRVGGKNGTSPLVEGFLSSRLWKLHMNRAMGDRNYTSVLLDLDRSGDEERGWEAPLRLLMTCRCIELPNSKSVDAWLALAHDLVRAVGALTGIVGVWPTYHSAVGDTWIARVVLDTVKGEYNLGLPDAFESQMHAVTRWEHRLGRTYARHPRWGTYLNAAHVAAIGGEERIRAEVEPAQIKAVGELTYIQLTESVDTALTPLAGERRRRLEALMAPIILGAGRE